VGGAGLAYAAGIEVRSFTIREVEIPCLPPGARPIRVLHVSDLHLTPSQGRKRAWLRSLARLEPDLVVNTGDNLAHLDALPALLDALGPLLDVPGAFVFGSNDYYAPSFKNPARYFTGPSKTSGTAEPSLPFELLRSELAAGGWADDASRAWFTRAFWPALQTYFGQDNLP
jgi:predicted MPP superfamily phosphohydrolase